MPSTNKSDATLQQLAEEIERHHKAFETALSDSLKHAIEAGKLLIRAKEQIEYGQWEKWRDENFSFAGSTARFYMQCARKEKVLKRQRVSDLVEQTVESLQDEPRTTLREARRMVAEPRKRTIETEVRKSEPEKRTITVNRTTTTHKLEGHGTFLGTKTHKLTAVGYPVDKSKPSEPLPKQPDCLEKVFNLIRETYDRCPREQRHIFLSQLSQWLNAYRPDL